MRLDINLATRPYEDARRFWLQWGSVVAAVGLFTLILVFMRAQRMVVRQQGPSKRSGTLQKDIAERDSEKSKGRDVS